MFTPYCQENQHQYVCYMIYVYYICHIWHMLLYSASLYMIYITCIYAKHLRSWITFLTTKLWAFSKRWPVMSWLVQGEQIFSIFKIPLKLVSDQPGSEVFQFLTSFNLKLLVMLISRQQAGSEVRLTLKHYKAATPFLLRQFGKWEPLFWKLILSSRTWKWQPFTGGTKL